MLNKIIEFSIRNKLVIGLFMVALVGYGVYQTTRLPIDAVPDITNNQVQVITVAPSFGATDIERLITFPIEQVNNNINGLVEIRSFSRFGLSLVTIVFDDDTDIYWARQQVAERLQKVQSQIPSGIGQPELGPITTGLGEIYQYVVRPKEGYENRYDETDLRTIQDWIVRRQLLGVSGVAEVSSFGGKLKQYEVSVDPNKLQAFNVSLNEVFTALEKNNQNTGGAYIEKGPTVLFIRSEGLIGSLEDIESIFIKSTDSNSPIFLRDIAKVSIGYATRFGAMCYNDKGEVAGAVVMMLKGANSNEVIKNVKERIAQIQKTLPEGVVIEPFLDRTKMVNNAIGTVEKNLMEGALIVVFILVLFLGNVRAGLLVASVIPLAMLFAIILMNTFGVSGNLMSLGALDFGLIVDGAVIIVEAVMHQLTHSKKFHHISRLSQPEMDEEVTQSASKMMNSAVFGQIIILIVYLPILTLQGIEGKMFKPMAQTVAFALIGAFILSLTYIPMMSALFLSKNVKHEPNFSDRVMFEVERLYQHWLQWILQIPKTILTIVGILFVTSLIVLSRLGGEFIPALEEGDFAVETRVLPGSNLNVMIENAAKAAEILKREFPEVEMVVTKIGSGEVPTDPMPIDAADVMIILKDKSEWTSAETFNELAEKMGKALENVPGVAFGFQFPVQMRFNELMTGAKQDVVCKIFGENLDTLAFYAAKLGRIVSRVEGSQSLYVEPITGLSQIVIEYNRAAIAQYQVSISDVNQVVNMAFAGQVAGQVFEEERRFDLVMRLQTDLRRNLVDVQNLLIPTPLGSHIPLYQLADVSIKNGPNQIQREDAKRRIVVGFNVRGRDVQSIVNELQGQVDTQLALPPGYYITYGGAFENLNQAKQRLLIAVPVSLLLIFVLLFFAFGSIKHGLLIYTAIPLSAIGGIYSLMFRGLPFSISAGVGFIALFGVAVLNGIVLIAEFNRLKMEGNHDLHRIVLMGTKIRLRPVLMTAFVASLGFLPMALSNGAGAEVQRPLATVVIGGLLMATFLTLFVLPILYVLFESKGSAKKPVVMTVLILFGLFNFYEAPAQSKVSLEEALNIASKNNLTLKNEVLKVSYQEKLVAASVNIPQTMISGQVGQMNSTYTDTGIGVSQSFSFPTVYTRQKSVQQGEWKTAVLTASLKESQLKRMVSQLFYSILIFEEKEKLLEETDKNYSDILFRAGLQVSAGEGTILEQALVENQRGGIAIQLRELRDQLELTKLQFQLVLNTPDVEPKGPDLKLVTLIQDSLLTDQHPMLKVLEQRRRVAEANVQLEKSRFLPELSIGVFDMSMRGTGADNLNYGPSTRFNSAQIGIGIPLFFGSQKSKLAASKTGLQIAENDYNIQKQQFDVEIQSAYVHYQTSGERVHYFEKTALPNAKLISRAAGDKLANGEINFFEWARLYNQSIDIQNGYLDALIAFNESVVALNYLTSN